jgi:ribonuclease P protein component
MLNLANRLKKDRDFNLIIKHGAWQNGQFFSLKAVKLDKIQDYYPKKEDVDKFKKQLKIAFSVGLKVSKSAVKRNRVKRQAREIVRLIMKETGIKEGYYLMIAAKPTAVDKTSTELSQDIRLLFQKSRLI